MQEVRTLMRQLATTATNDKEGRMPFLTEGGEGYAVFMEVLTRHLLTRQQQQQPPPSTVTTPIDTTTTTNIDKHQHHFITPHKPMSALDMDLIKLLALFWARNGHALHHSLVHSNSNGNGNDGNNDDGGGQFPFLSPRHSLFCVVSGLREAYARVLVGGAEGGGMKEMVGKYAWLERVRRLAEHQHQQHDQQHDQQHEHDQHQHQHTIHSSVDVVWHPFSILMDMSLPNEGVRPSSRRRWMTRSLVERRSLFGGNHGGEQEEQEEEQEEEDMLIE
jgi:hypothetical protein